MSSDFYAAPPPPEQKVKRPPRQRRVKRPDGAMVMRNRRLIAERLRWPAGALDECLRLERECPGFEVAWFGEWKVADPVWCRAEGFYAWFAGDEPLHLGRKRREWYGATAAELKAKLYPGL